MVREKKARQDARAKERKKKQKLKQPKKISTKPGKSATIEAEYLKSRKWAEEFTVNRDPQFTKMIRAQIERKRKAPYKELARRRAVLRENEEELLDINALFDEAEIEPQ